VAKVGFETSGDVHHSQSPLELGDFQVAGCDLLSQLLFMLSSFFNFLAGGQGSLVYGGDESKGHSIDGIIDVGVHVEQDFCGAGGD